MTRLAILLAMLALPAGGADRVFTGSVESVEHASITIRLDGDLPVNASLPAGFAVTAQAGDEVELVCAPVKTVYDAEAGLHNHLRVKTLRLLRAAENAPPILSGPEPDLAKIRAANLEYVAKLPDFLADEILRTYLSEGVAEPWRLDRTVEDEVGFRGFTLIHQNIRKNGKPWKPSPPQLAAADFGLHVNALFSPECPTRLEFIGRQEMEGKPILVYRFHSPQDGCRFGSIGHNGRVVTPAAAGRVLLDADTGRVLRCEWEGRGFPENFICDRLAVTQQWEYATIGDSRYLLPASVDVGIRKSDGSAVHLTTVYGNHRHFEAATSVKFH